MLHKKLLCAALALIVNCIYIDQIHAYHVSNNHTLPIGKSKVINKTTTLQFFKEKKVPKKNKDLQKISKKPKQNQKLIAIIRYSWTSDRTTIHLDLFKIMSRKNRKKGLGKQLFTYFIQYLKKAERAAKTICWTAQTLDPKYISQEKLETFYKSIGGTKLYSETCTHLDCTCKSPRISQFSLEIDDFTLTDTSLLQTINIIEESNITRIKTLELAEKSHN